MRLYPVLFVVVFTLVFIDYAAGMDDRQGGARGGGGEDEGRFFKHGPNAPFVTQEINK